VHAHDPHAVALGAQAIAMLAAGERPALVAARRVDFHIKKNTFSRWKYRQVDRFVCASEAIRKILIADGIPAERTVTVHEGIDLHHVRAQPPLSVHAELYLPKDAPLVGNVAALAPHKGHRYLIDAAAQVVRQVPDVRFVILGEGELRGALERQIHELHLERHVLLAGFRPDALRLLKTFDVFVLASVTEGLGTSLLDAMACEKPIVATTAGGIPEVVQHGVNGLLVPPRNVPALARALVKLLRDAPLRQRLAHAGARIVAERFTAERMVRETLVVYHSLVGEEKRSDLTGRGGGVEKNSI
jgi:glycosyltransferase involved in cell wall biosynthesis